MKTTSQSALVHAIPGPDDILRRELPNGIIVLARANPHSPSVTVSGYLHAGGIFDQDATLGLADFTASALMRGTRSLDFNQLYDRLEAVGASLGFSGGTHTAGFGGRSLADDLPMLLGLLADTLRQPAFPARQVERLRAELLTSLDFQMQDSRDRAGMAFDELVYPGHPYSRPDEGTPQTIRRIRRGDLVRFHQRHYGPHGMVIALVGGVEPERAADLVTAALGDWRNPRQPETPDLPEWQPPTERRERRVVMADKSQADIMIGTAGPPRSAPDFRAASIGDHILGKFGMMGRLGARLREEAGLAYYAYSSLHSSPGPGAWYAAAGVDPRNVSQAIDLILDEIDRFTREPVSPDELSDVQSNLIGSQPIALESNMGVASLLLHIERHNLGLDYLQHYQQEITSVTPEQVLAAAARYLPVDRLAVVVAGPKEELPDA